MILSGICFVIDASLIKAEFPEFESVAECAIVLQFLTEQLRKGDLHMQQYTYPCGRMSLHTREPKSNLLHRRKACMTISPKSPELIRIILIGDVVGKPGINMLCDSILWLRQVLGADLIIANAENAADGAGLTNVQYKKIISAGVDAVTLGDHIYRKKEIAATLQSESNIVKPANFPASSPGKEYCVVITPNGTPVAVMSLLGRVFMRPVDCPFAAVARVLGCLPDEIKIRVIDFHAEATSDKQSMGRFLDGKVTAVLGTHTHVPTADEEIFPGGTAFQCDVGMTGPYFSILGRDIEPVLNTTVSFDPNSFHVATQDIRLSGTWIDADPITGKAVRIARLQLRPDELNNWRAAQQ
ncbi:MAG: TIGR00282 family metallophosphoesterase [Pirellula sp.]